MLKKVLIVDDHESMSDSLFQALKTTENFIVVGSLKSADHAELYCMKLKPDLIFMDVCTEGGASGLDAIKTIREKYPEPKVIVTSMGEAPLTEREMEVLRLLCKHMTNQEIASELFISEHTVKYHKSNMLAKTGFNKTVDLAFYLISNGLINPHY